MITVCQTYPTLTFSMFIVDHTHYQLYHTVCFLFLCCENLGQASHFFNPFLSFNFRCLKNVISLKMKNCVLSFVCCSTLPSCYLVQNVSPFLSSFSFSFLSHIYLSSASSKIPPSKAACQAHPYAPNCRRNHRQINYLL